MKTKQITTFLYGLSAIVVGIWRHLETGDSPQAAWFGLVMGLLAIVGSGLLFLKNRYPGYILISLSICTVGWWFLKRMISGHADGTSPRVILILIILAIEIGVLLWRCPKDVSNE